MVVVYLFQRLYMFRAASAHYQEGQRLLIYHLAQHTPVGDHLAGWSGGKCSFDRGKPEVLGEKTYSTVTL